MSPTIELLAAAPVFEDERAAPAPAPVVLARPLAPAPAKRTLAVKHALDTACAATLLVLLAPLLVLIALAIKATSPGPVLYRQRRIGRDGRPFDILKFRSMRGHGTRFTPRPGAAPGGVEGPDRRTLIGKLLRRSSLDELPQLLNVLRGDMSLVGPRPERPEYVRLFADEVPGYTDRHRVRVGMTGLAQVRGLRGQTSIAHRTAADNEYIDSWSLLLDLKVLLLTFRALLQPAE